MLLLALACAEPPEGLPEGLSLTGQLRDLEGSPLSGGHLQACAAVCVVTETDGDGVYLFEGLEAGTWSIHASGPSEDAADLVIPWELPGDPLDLVIPQLLEPTPVPDELTEVEVAEGLVLALSPELLPGVDTVRAAPLPGPDWPALPGVPGSPLQGWSLSPSGAGLEIPFLTEGEPWCTSADGRTWEPCEGTLPELGSIVVIEP
jgi:hypothetical protein